MGKSVSINFNAITEKSLVKVAPGPAIFGESLPAFYLKAFPEERGDARGFVFKDQDVARKFLTDFAALCWHKDGKETLKILKTLVKAMEKASKPKKK